MKSSPCEEEDKESRWACFDSDSRWTLSHLFLWRLPTVLRGRDHSAPKVVASDLLGSGGVEGAVGQDGCYL